VQVRLGNRAAWVGDPQQLGLLLTRLSHWVPAHQDAAVELEVPTVVEPYPQNSHRGGLTDTAAHLRAVVIIIGMA
jgi:hypothetical protein